MTLWVIGFALVKIFSNSCALIYIILTAVSTSILTWENCLSKDLYFKELGKVTVIHPLEFDMPH